MHHCRNHRRFFCWHIVFATILLASMGCTPSTRGGLGVNERQQFRNDAVMALKDAALSDDPYLTSNAIEAISESRAQDASIAIEKNLDTGNRAVTFAALMGLGTLRNKDMIEQYRAAAGDPDPNVRVAAIYALYRCGDPSKVGELGRLLTSDPQASVRANSAFVLGRMGQPGATKLLRSALAREKDELARRGILEALAILKDRRSVNSLIAYGYSADPGQATAGLGALGNARCSEAEGLFLDRLNRAEAPEVRLQAARGLGRIGYRGYDAGAMLDLATAHLFFRTTTVKDPAEPADVQIRRVRALAALALEAIGSPDALKPLREAFDAPGQNPYVRVAVARAALGIIDSADGRRTAAISDP